MSDGRSERELLLVGTLVVGRDPVCEISGDNSLLSRRHAEFLLQADEVFVRDLGSRNGVFVNGVKVAETSLQRGDVVQIGHLQLRYVEDATPLARALDARPAAVSSAATVTVATPAIPTPREVSPAPPIVAPDDDDDYTRLVPPPVSVSDARRGPAEADEDEDEYTRLVVPPVRQAPPAEPLEDAELTGYVPAPTVHSHVLAPAVEDDEYTRLVRPPASALASSPERATAVSHVPAAVGLLEAQTVGGTGSTAVVAGALRTARHATGSWTTFVFGQMTVLAVVACAAVLAPSLAGAGGALTGGAGLWLFGSAATAVIAVYVVGTAITRRTVRALADLSQDVESAAQGSLEAVGDPVGAEAVKDLANSVNRIVAQLRATADKHDRHEI